MEPSTSQVQPPSPHRIFQVTPLSKYLAMVLFVIMPFFAGYTGYQKGLSSQPPTILYQNTPTQLPTAEDTASSPTISAPSTTIPNIEPNGGVPASGTVTFEANNLALVVTYASSVESILTVTDSGVTLQTVRLPTEERFTDFCTDDNGDVHDNVKLQDIDFDGDLDFGILSVEAGGHCAYDYYTYYRYDASARQYSTSSPLYFSGTLSVNNDKKTLTFLSRLGMNWVESTYYFKDGMYHLESETNLYIGSDAKSLEELAGGRT